MNFEEWREKKRKESAFLPERESDSGEWSGQQRRRGGSFGGLQGTVDRPHAGRSGRTMDADKSTYSPIKGIAGGLQKGLTNIAKKGGSVVALAEDIQYALPEVITGRKLGTFSDNGSMNLWNDSIQRAAASVEDYYADNVAAGGKTAELLDKSVSKVVSLLPSIAMDYFMPGAGAASELGNAAANSLPGMGSSFRTVSEKLVKDPRYWLSVAGTMGERYEDGLKELEDMDLGNWVNTLTRSAAESLYKEAINTSKVLSDNFPVLTELAYEMYGQEVDEEKESFLDELAKLFLG